VLVGSNFPTTHPVALSPGLLSGTDPVNNAPTTARRLKTCRKQVLQNVQPGQSLVGYGKKIQTHSSYNLHEPLVGTRAVYGGAIIVTTQCTRKRPNKLSPRLSIHTDPVNNDPSTARSLNTCRNQVLQNVRPDQSLVGYGTDEQARSKYYCRV